MEDGRGGNRGSEARGDRPRDETVVPGSPMVDQTAKGTITHSSAEGLSSGDGVEDRSVEVGDDEHRRTPVIEWRMPMTVEAEGPRIQ